MTYNIFMYSKRSKIQDILLFKSWKRSSSSQTRYFTMTFYCEMFNNVEIHLNTQYMFLCYRTLALNKLYVNTANNVFNVTLFKECFCNNSNHIPVSLTFTDSCEGLINLIRCVCLSNLWLELWISLNYSLTTVCNYEGNECISGCTDGLYEFRG